MNNRPPSITVISWLFILLGGIGFLYHLSEFTTRRPIDLSVVGVCLVRLVAILSGVFMLRGSNWARWLLIVWMVYHVILSAFHSLSEAAMHIVLFGVVAYFLFRPPSSTYFRGMTANSAQSPKGDKTRVG